ncbi:uncharacterized protein LOC112687586 [Sipha flava]|uniref:Uncharacterized protein LOC112687586 n=1 Tax=Sipha flava TaxID=143950 RepID=A0A8B8G0P1_9HEMI|nr:uncharacterized protein LOC112687586 [Sipha flava]
MKNQAIEINFTVVLYAGIMYTGLVISGWLLLRLTVACFKLPSILSSGQLLGPDIEDELENMQQALIKEEVNEDSSLEKYFDTLTQDSCNITTIRSKLVGIY